MTAIDLNAARAARAAKREAGGKPVTVVDGDRVYELPAELPGDVLTPLLDGDLDLAWLLRSAFDAYRTATDTQQQQKLGDLLVAELVANPNLPVDVLKAIRAALQRLFGDEQWGQFWADHPSLPDLVELIKGLVREYGVGLGEASSSSTPSSPGGATSKPTSSGSTVSTPVVAGVTPITPSF